MGSKFSDLCIPIVRLSILLQVKICGYGSLWSPMNLNAKLEFQPQFHSPRNIENDGAFGASVYYNNNNTLFTMDTFLFILNRTTKFLGSWLICNGAMKASRLYDKYNTNLLVYVIIYYYP